VTKKKERAEGKGKGSGQVKKIRHQESGQGGEYRGVKNSVTGERGNREEKGVDLRGGSTMKK